jgi:predicted ATPase
MIVEDLHWIDRVSEEMLGKIVGGGASLSLLVLVTRRPEYVPSWLDQPEVMRLTLAPLAADDIGQLVCSRLGVSQLPTELTRLIANRAEGNALFAEEIVSFLTERGMLRTSAEKFDYDAAAVAAAMPASVQGLLTSRVDRLAADDRTLLQAASVIGRHFDPELLAAVVPDASDTQSRLESMCRLDLVYPDGRSGDYAFKHALVRDALYQSLLTAPRTALHLKIAEEIERRGQTRLSEVAEMLAQHYSQTDRDDKAFAY